MAVRECDILVQAGHENTPDRATGGEGPLGKEIEWTPIVANEAVAILRAAGIDVVKEDASIKHTDRTYRCKLAVFLHFDAPDSGESGPSVGYDHDSDASAAKEWKTLYSEYFPFTNTWRPDNFTEDEHHYYGFSHTFTSDAEFLIEFGDLQSLRQAQWLQPRLKWLGSLLAYFLSHRSGLGNLPKPAPFDEERVPALPHAPVLRSAGLRGDGTLEAVAAGHLLLSPSGARVDGAGAIQDALQRLAAAGHPDYNIDFQGNPNLRGFYGPKTAGAVRAFQRDHGLPQSGSVDAATLLALDEALLALEPPISDPQPPEGGGEDPLEPSPGAQPSGPAEPFRTPAASSNSARGSSKTSGLTGTTQAFDDGTLVTDATEQLRAIRADGLNSSLVGHWRRVQKGNTFSVRQENYSYGGRVLPDGALFLDMDGLDEQVPQGFTATEARTVIATQFGKRDREDEGTGSPIMGTIQTNSEVVGASVKVSVMRAVFGDDWTHNHRRLGALAEVYFAQTRRRVRVPLVDVGPGEHAPSHAEVDLTLACDQFLGTEGRAEVEYRILVPAE